MPPFSLRHPALDQLADFTDASISDDERRVADHVAECSTCRTTVQQLRAARAAVRDAQPVPLTPALRERMLASRATGARVILPVADPLQSRSVRSSRRWITVGVAAAAVVVTVLGEGLWLPDHEADAGAVTGTLTVMPSLPRPGQALHITYTAPASLAGHGTLVLRARLRSVNENSYETGVPVRAVASLVRGTDGRFQGRVSLPDSIVFAALVVEDSTGSVIDDHAKRTWEVLTTSNGVNPSLSSLNQRIHDMMGRSFEEGRATAERALTLYPDSVSVLSWLKMFEMWMGQANVDSLNTRHRTEFARLDRLWRAAPVVPSSTLGELSWYSRLVDTTAHQYWRARLMREAPTNGFALQWRLLDVTERLAKLHDTAAAFQSFDTLWTERSPDRAEQIAGNALRLAVASSNREWIDSWALRLLTASRGSMAMELSIAEDMVRVPSLVPDGMHRLRHVISTPPAAGERRLAETVARYDLRSAAVRRRALASLGRTLVTTGATRAGLDTLTIAASAGWDLPVVRAIRLASFTAGDSATGWVMTARLLADPTTDSSARDTLGAQATRALGAERWHALVRDGKRTFAQRMMEDSRAQSVSESARVSDVRDRKTTLKSLAANRVTVVVFWSRFCGWALDDLDNIRSVAHRLGQSGAQLVLVVDDEPASTPALTTFLTDRKVNIPVYSDADHSTGKALNNWGTPTYYVLDQKGRLRFAAVNSARDALVRAEALRVSGEM